MKTIAVEKTSLSSFDQPKTYEDKLKENFAAGRMELERRRRALQEKQEKEEVHVHTYVHVRTLCNSCIVFSGVYLYKCTVYK